MSVDEEPIVDAAWLRRKAARCLELARLAINPEVINGLAELVLEFEAKARAFDQETRSGTATD
jgi:hypothetical protein